MINEIITMLDRQIEERRQVLVNLNAAIANLTPELEALKATTADIKRRLLAMQEANPVFAEAYEAAVADKPHIH